MIVNSGTRWLPEPETFGSKSGRGCRPKGADWPSAAILRWASKWCASLVEESSRQSIKVVENFGGAKKGRMTVIMRADCVCLAIARVPASAETVAGAAAHHRGGPFAWAEVLGNFTGGAECGDICFGGEMHACRLGGGQTRLQLQSMARMVPASRRSRRGLRSGDLWLTTLPMQGPTSPVQPRQSVAGSPSHYRGGLLSDVPFVAAKHQ
jgi:hypothetical protein